MANQSGDGSPAYEQTTEGITVRVQPFYLEEQSSPESRHFVWAYHVRIQNNGAATVQLLNRYWRITDCTGNVQEVRGEGVVGKQPVLRPGEAFEYASGTPLSAPSGIMVGIYYMETEDGEPLDVSVPAFSLDSPHQSASVH